MKTPAPFLLLCLFLSLPGQERFFSIGVDEGPGNDFGKALADAMALGINAQQLFLNWSDLEPDSGVYDFANHYITWAPAFYAVYGLKLITYVNPVHMWYRTVPRDLENEPWDSPRMISRYKTLLDTLKHFIGDETAFFVIGNEVNSYLADSAQFSAYRVFFNSAKTYFKALEPAARIGVVLTAGELFTSPLKRFALSLQDSADVFMVTYYGGFGDTFIAPARLIPFMDSLVALAGNKPLAITELGYPSSPYLGSSPARQADFISAAFDAWETHKNSIPLIHFMKQWEWTRADIYSWLDSSLAAPAFMEFLTSIGVHDSLGNPKPAWDTLRAKALQYGFADKVETGAHAGSALSGLQAFPNPFNPSTTLRVRGPASLDIYDIRGRRVSSLSVTPDENEVRWDASGMPSGVYLITAKSGGSMVCRRIFLGR